VLRDLNLWERFRWRVVSARVGVEKPDPAIFRHALGLCGLPAGRVLHVGDSLAQDVQGAREAGWGALWLRRDGVGDANGAISGLTQLLALIR
jgi:putative hydrolase of the HAD superfamily